MSSSPSNPPNNARWGSHSRTESSSRLEPSAMYGGLATIRSKRGVARQGVEPRPVGDAYVHGRPPEPGEVRPRDVERIGVDIGDPHRGARVWELVGEGEADRSRTGAEIGDGDRRTASPAPARSPSPPPARSRVAGSVRASRRRGRAVGSSSDRARTAGARRCGAVRASSRDEQPSGASPVRRASP